MNMQRKEITQNGGQCYRKFYQRNLILSSHGTCKIISHLKINKQTHKKTNKKRNNKQALLL